MKKLILTLAISAGVASSSFAFEADLLTLLTGDTRLSCEAILCLSSSVKPGECQPSLNRFFSIKKKKWSDTLNARKAFLNLCPVGEAGESDMEFKKLRDDILVYVSEPCNVEHLNSRIEYKTIRKCGERRCHDVPISARVNPKLPDSCRLLQTSKYTDIRVEYTCSSEFFPIEEWNKGESRNEIPKAFYNSLKQKDESKVEAVENTSRICRRSRGNFAFCEPKYYQKIAIKKDCWEEER